METSTQMSDELSGEKGSKESSVSSSLGPPLLAINYIRVVLLDASEKLVIMENVGDRWDLPYFILPWGFHGNILECVEHFQGLLDLESEEPMFTGVADLIGEVGCMHARGYDAVVNVGYAKLLLFEQRADMPEMKQLPPGFEWKNVDFVSSIVPDPDWDTTTEYVLRPVLAILRRKSPLYELLPHPPFQKGWFQKASDWLVAEVIRQGESPISVPRQFRLSHSSAIVVIDSTNGPFFLKGLPVRSHEFLITKLAAKLTPDYIPEVVAVNVELQAFATRAFERRKHQEEDRVEMLRTLAKVQKRSMGHVERLVDAGVPALLLENIDETLNGWTENEAFISLMYVKLSEFKEIIPTIVAMAKELATYNLPMCLVHGDFAERNTGYKVLDDGSERIILHDWQFGAISHPFFDFHDFREEWDDLIDIYLGMWGEYESLERAREAYGISRVLGWLLKLRSVIDGFIPGEPARRFGAPVSEIFFEDCYGHMRQQVKAWADERNIRHPW